MIVDQLYNNKKNINEGLADEFMAMAKAKGYNPRLRGTPDEERARTDAMMKQRAADRANAPGPEPVSNEERAKLQARLKELQADFDPNFEYSDDHSFWRSQHEIKQQIDRIKKRLSESKLSKKHQLNESLLMEDPVYRNFKRVGQYIAERKLSEKEILQIFADAEAGMTDKATGANRTFLGRGKDTTMDFAGGVADALKGVWSGIQSSVPVAAVDVAYDQATDALAGLAGGQKGAVMQAIKKYRNLAKQYPKTAGLAKGALVAITGLATGGAGLPAVAALVYGLDSAIRGEKLSDIALKAGGAAATAWAGQKIASAFSGDTAAAGANASGFDPSQLPAFDDAGNLAPGFHINPENGIPYYNGELTPTPADIAAGLAPDTAAAGAAAGAPVSGGTYTTMPGDQGGFIAQANGVPFEQLKAANPQITNWNKLPVGTELQLPPSGANTGSVWQGSTGAGGGAGPELLGGPAAGDVAQSASSQLPPGIVQRPSLNIAPGDYAPAPGSTGANVGTLSGVTADEIARSPLYQQFYAQQIAPYGANPSAMAMQKASEIASLKTRAAMAGVLRESQIISIVESGIKFKTLPIDKLVDQKSTVLTWALNESVGRKSSTLTLTPLGVITVFENVERWRSAIMELKGVPGSTRPNYYRPDMPGAPDPTKPPKKQSWFGKGLDYLDKGMKKVGGALSNFGHQFTTNVTKEKLKMNWHQAGKPSDSDALSAWLVKQGVPIGVVNSVYQKMGLPVSAEPVAGGTAEKTSAQTPAGGLAQKELPFYGTNPKTGKPWTVDQLQARQKEKVQAAAASIPAGPGVPVDPNATPAPPKFGSPAVNQVPMTGFNATNVMNLPGMSQYKKPATAKTPNFAGPGGYKSVTTSFKPSAVAKTPAAAPSAPAKPKVVSGGPTPDEQAKLAQRIAQAAKQPVAEMLSMVETKEDIRRIKQFIDQTFVKYGAVSESAFAVRNKLIEHVTQVGAQRRREHARKS